MLDSCWLSRVATSRGTQFESAKVHVERTRELMVTDLAALVGESYERAYTDMVRVQQLAELGEVIAYKQALERRQSKGQGPCLGSVLVPVITSVSL